MRLSARALGLMCVMFTMAAAAEAKTVIVTTQADTTVAGGCAAHPDNCSLRDAITATNADGNDTIDFNIGDGTNKVITITSPLPSIVGGQTIDGTSEPNTSSSEPIELHAMEVDGEGLTISAGSGTTIRGLAIGGFQGDGIDVTGTSENTTIAGDSIGVRASGDSLGNIFDGVKIDGDAQLVTVGGFGASDRVVIGQNQGAGVEVTGDADFVTIEGDYIGLAPDGAGVRQNGTGVLVDGGATNVQIGNGAAQRLYLSGNTGAGLKTSGTATVHVNNATIGLAVDGSTAVPNAVGIDAAAPGLAVGTCCAASALDTVSGNTGDGIKLEPGATGATINNTVIGANSAETAAAGNGAVGVDLGAAGATIDGATLIGANAGDGVRINADGASVLNAEIGHTGSVPDVALPNGGDGIDVVSGSDGAVGTAGTAGGPDIADNAGAGLAFAGAPTGWTVGGASFAGNGGLGIDLGADGVTANDPANGHPSFPEITAFTATDVKGTYHGKPNAKVMVSVFQTPACDPSGNGEGAPFLASIPVTTDASGNGTWDAPYTAGQLVDPVLSAIAQTSDGVSEFGPCKAADTATSVAFSAATYTASAGTSSVTITVNRSGNTTATSSVLLATGGGTAKSGTDYQPISTTVSFAAGQTTATVPLTLVSDPALTSTATIGLTLSGPVGAQVGTPATAVVTIPPTAAGTTTTTTTTGTTTRPGTGTSPAGVADRAPQARITPLGAHPKAKKLKMFTGTASDDHGVTGVRIALIKLGKGAKAASAKHAGAPACSALTATGRLHAQKTVGGKCLPTTFLLAKGTTKWSFTLKHALPAGSYVLYAVATDTAGQHDAGISAKLGNRIAFTLK